MNSNDPKQLNGSGLSPTSTSDFQLVNSKDLTLLVEFTQGRDAIINGADAEAGAKIIATAILGAMQSMSQVTRERVIALLDGKQFLVAMERS